MARFQRAAPCFEEDQHALLYHFKASARLGVNSVWTSTACRLEIRA